MPQTLAEWLAYIEGIASRPIDLGLERTRAVLGRLPTTDFRPTVITVGGTNGKGSTCAMLERILLCGGYRVGLYASPHLLRYNERVRVQGVEADDGALMAAFARVEAARGDTPLTYFEFGTLAAWEVFRGHPLDVVVLEVGLGGRLDAVNAFEPDCSVVTNVDLDHQDYLGPTRETIGFEKAGIFRTGTPAVCGDLNPPHSLVAHADSIGVPLWLAGRDFGWVKEVAQWQYWSRRDGGASRRMSLAHPALRGINQLANASTAIAALECVHDTIPVAAQDIRRGLAEVVLPGRFQVLPGRPAVVLDVAHNPLGAKVLADALLDMGFFHRTRAVFGMLADKDIGAVVDLVAHRVDEWYVTDLPGPRGASAQTLEALLWDKGASRVRCFGTPAEAFRAAQKGLGDDDRILVFGSFLTVADVMEALSQSPPHG